MWLEHECEHKHGHEHSLWQSLSFFEHFKPVCVGMRVRDSCLPGTIWCFSACVHRETFGSINYTIQKFFGVVKQGSWTADGQMRFITFYMLVWSHSKNPNLSQHLSFYTDAEEL